ncbi:DUF3473 domain-containing protein [Marinobacter sp. MIT932201]|uniref:DUF3473 domain-containing protein n=1 Tax=Marinobacter sp. MIT932201 TaxID=3096995 RepID=UPI00399A374F
MEWVATFSGLRIHPWEVDPGQPRLDVKWFSRFRHYNNLDVCEQRLAQLLKRFRFTTMSHVLQSQGLLDIGYDTASSSSNSDRGLETSQMLKTS